MSVTGLPFLYQVNVGLVPALDACAVKFPCPPHNGIAGGFTVMVAGCATVTVLESGEVVLLVTHPILEVMVTLMTSPLLNEEVLNVLLLFPTALPFLFQA